MKTRAIVPPLAEATAAVAAREDQLSKVLALAEALRQRERAPAWAAFVRDTNARAACEVGVWKGDFADEMLGQAPSLERYYAVDPWRHIEGWNKPFNVTDAEFREIFRGTTERLAKWAPRVTVLRAQTQEAVEQIPDNSLDFVYLDGDHTLRGVFIDLMKIWPKVKPGGWIAGDDYTRDVWDHGVQYSPTLVYPFAAYFAEAQGCPFYELPLSQCLIKKPLGAAAYAYRDLRFGNAESAPPVLDVPSPRRPPGNPLRVVASNARRIVPRPAKSLLKRARWLVQNKTLEARAAAQHPGIPIDLFNRTGFAFVHIPKNAGSAVSFALYGRQTGHETWEDLYNMNPVRFRGWTKFAVVRDPVSRFVSAYDFLRAGGMNEQDKRLGETLQRRFPSINALIKSMMNRDEASTIMSEMHFRPQSGFVCDYAGVCKVNRLVRLEFLQQDLVERVPEFAWGSSIPRINETLGDRTPIGSLSEESIAVLLALYKTDVQLYRAAAVDRDLYGRRLVG